MRDIRPGIWSCLQTNESERHRRCNEDFPPIMARRGFSGPAAVSATGPLGRVRRRYSLPHGARPPVGVLRAEFDASALTLSRLNATRLIVRFADGTLIDTELADILPPVRDVSDVMQDSVEVLLALPLLSASGGNLDDGQESARPRRWRAEQVTVQELAGHERSELAVLRHALTLRLSTEENAAFLTCPVARLVHDAQGQWIVDPEFIPPLLSLAASPTLVSELGELLHRLQARRRRLMAMRRESNARMADFAVADVSLFWLLNALNSAEPVLSELHQDPSRHPELLYRELARLAGSLLTFSLEHHLEAIPRYRHASPEQVFPPLFALLDTLLEVSLPSRVIAIALEQGADREIWRGRLHDARLREGADFYLSVRSSLPLTSYRAAFRSSVRRVAMMMSPRSSILPSAASRSNR